MQENLDVLISFVIVIVGLSVLVQIVVEMFKNLLKTRWGVYEKFIKELYQNYFLEQAAPEPPVANSENPADPKKAKGRANPMAFIAEQAGGYASHGRGRILDIDPDELHERTPLFIGNKEEVLKLEGFIRKFGKYGKAVPTF